MERIRTRGYAWLCLCVFIAALPEASLPQRPAASGPVAAARIAEVPLIEAAKAGDLPGLRKQLKRGVSPGVRDRTGRTALMYAAEQGHADIVHVLLEAGADPNVAARGWGTALESAERSGHEEIALILRQAGARSSGHSAGDTVCVRPWHGDGYCGNVLSVAGTSYHIRVTQIIGCKDGCAARDECSAGRLIGGQDGIVVGSEIDTVSWCLTHTEVKP